MVLLMAGLPASALGDGSPQILGDADLEFCKCPVSEEGRTCDDLRVEVESLWPFTVDVFLNGEESVREVRFGLLAETDEGIGWAVCPGGFIDAVTDTFPGPEYEVTLTAEGGCHTIADGFHFLACFAFNISEAGTVRIVPDPRIGVAQITTCDGAVITLPEERLATIGVGGKPGFNPCKDSDDVPLSEETWSTVKGRYESPQ
jgi:hypothetical protein